MDFVRRNSRRVIAAAAVGAAGAAAAYYAYQWWYADDDYGSAEAESRRGGEVSTSRQAAAEDEPSSPTSVGLQHLQQHFQSIQAISDNTTFPKKLPQLAEFLFRAADVSQLTERLRRCKGAPGSEGAAEKLALWAELKEVAFTRTIAAAWALPLLDLMLRVQLNILGRHLYLLSAVQSRNVWPGDAPLPRLTQRGQELFLSYGDFLPQRGLVALVAAARQVVARVVGGVDLRRPVSADEVLQYVSNIHTEFAEVASAAGWITFLLPSQREVERAMSRALSFPDLGALTEAGDAPDVDENVVDKMVEEVHSILRSAAFERALKASVQTAAREVAAEIRRQLGTQPVPFAKVVPVIAAAANPILSLDPERHLTTDCAARIAELPEVQSLCASIYTCKPQP